MKSFIIGAALLLPAGTLCAQIFNQQSTREKLQLEQIALLKLYRLSAQKGYVLSTKGWAKTDTLAAAEYNLHAQYIAGLSAINPQIFNYVQNHSVSHTGAGH